MWMPDLRESQGLLKTLDLALPFEVSVLPPPPGLPPLCSLAPENHRLQISTYSP